MRTIEFGRYISTSKRFFGPIGVLKEYRGKDIGRVLLLARLRALLEMGCA